DAVIDPTFPVVALLPDGGLTARLERGELRPSILRRALKGSGKALITTSSVGIFGDTGPTPLDENTPVRLPPNFRYQTRLEQQILRSDDVCGVVIRPAMTHGLFPDSMVRTMSHFASHYRRGTYIMPGTN